MRRGVESWLDAKTVSIKDCLMYLRNNIVASFLGTENV